MSFSRLFARTSRSLSGIFPKNFNSHAYGLKKKVAFLGGVTASCAVYLSGEKKTETTASKNQGPKSEQKQEEHILSGYNPAVANDPYTIVLKSKTVCALLTILRDENTGSEKFALTAHRLLRILAEEALGELTTATKIRTPCGPANGLKFPDQSTICGVSIIRSGDILLEQLRRVASGISVGKILIQRDETDPEKRPVLYYSKLPPDIAKKTVILVDPMLGTGGSSMAAIKVLENAGVKPENILFINVIACPEGINRIHQTYPKLKIVTCAVDEELNSHKYIVPGLGDFGDRYYGT